MQLKLFMLLTNTLPGYRTKFVWSFSQHFASDLRPALKTPASSMLVVLQCSRPPAHYNLVSNFWTVIYKWIFWSCSRQEKLKFINCKVKVIVCQFKFNCFPIINFSIQQTTTSAFIYIFVMHCSRITRKYNSGEIIWKKTVLFEFLSSVWDWTIHKDTF